MKPERVAAATHSSLALRRALVLLMLMLSVAVLFTVFEESSARATKFAAEATQGEGQDFSKFSHSSARHVSLRCADCHARRDNAAEPTLPGHKACTNCHLAQFTTPNVPLCSICHTSLDSQNPPVKAFPQSFKERFNMKFDHAQHSRGAARPDKFCASCHAPARRGVALTMLSGIPAHNVCFTCHKPGAESGGRDIASCQTCHALAAYAKASPNARAYQASFSHADHGPRQRLDCENCHNITAGAPLNRQVSSTATAQHFPSARASTCATCHNGKRAFGDTDFGDCKRCHKGRDFNMP